MKIDFRHPTIEDIEYITDNIRPDDKKEINIVCEHDIYTALMESARSSDECAIATIDDRPVCIFGVQRHSDRLGFVWLIGTNELDTVPRSFVKYSRKVLDELHTNSRCDIIGNIMYVRNNLHKKWLSWLGFVERQVVMVKDEEFVWFDRKI